MKKNKKVIFNGVFLVAVFALTIYGVFHGEDLESMMDAIRSADKRWLAPGLALVAFFIWGESIIIWYMMRSYGIKVKKKNMLSFFIGGFFLQLYHTVCKWRTADAGILHEKEKYTHTGIRRDSYDNYDYIQTGACCDRNRRGGIWKRIFTSVS